ncbi:hypothetical protein Scep_009060 [Stephania cephalantha]|uniref:Uncharacterized protein n=1 Tax=Stephania cephalantha TaxID=152367 RepID=A0AAP0JT07_9MAGN
MPAESLGEKQNRMELQRSSRNRYVNWYNHFNLLRLATTLRVGVVRSSAAEGTIAQRTVIRQGDGETIAGTADADRENIDHDEQEDGVIRGGISYLEELSRVMTQ